MGRKGIEEGRDKILTVVEFEKVTNLSKRFIVE